MIGQAQSRLRASQTGHRDLSQRALVSVQPETLIQVTNPLLAPLGNVTHGSPRNPRDPGPDPRG